MDLQTYFLGARLLYWLYLGLTLLLGGTAVGYAARELLLKKIYSIRAPERLIKIPVFYPGNWVRYFYRLIPTDGVFHLPGGQYSYTDKAIYKNKDVFAYAKGQGLAVDLDGKTYELDLTKAIKKRFEPWPEIHYFYGQPLPINYAAGEAEQGEPKIIYNAEDMARLRKSTILTQIYNALGGANLLAVLVVLVLIAIIISGVNLANNAGWIHLAQNTTQAVTTAAKVVKP